MNRTEQEKANSVYTSCLDYIKTGEEMWGSYGFEPYGEGQDPSSLMQNIQSLQPEGAAFVLNRLSDKLNEAGNHNLDCALDNFIDNVYLDLGRETDPIWFEDFKTYFKFD